MNKFPTGVCPKCNGCFRMAIEPQYEQYKKILSGYDLVSNTLPCNNCGGQYMYTSPKGMVRLRPDGNPCMHDYKDVSDTHFRSLRNYQCTHCQDSYEIDSGD